MSIQSSSEGVPPVAAGDAQDDMIDRATEDGQTVGAADAAEDARRAGADRDTPLRDTVEEGALDAGADAERATDGGEAVGAADAEADRLAAGADDRG
ncbi:hypothetical protein ACI8AF_19685 [Blastococcus sp. SYSU D00669]